MKPSAVEPRTGVRPSSRSRNVKRKRRTTARQRRLRRLLITIALLFVAVGLFRLAAARRHLVQAKTALADARSALATGHVDQANNSFSAAERKLWAARSGSGFPVAILNPIPLLGSPGVAVRDTVKAGLHAVSAGRALAKAEEAFPIHGHTGLNGSDLAPLHQSIVDAQAPLAVAGRELAASQRDLHGPAGATLPPLSGPARAELPVLAQTQRQLDGVTKSLHLLSYLTAPDTDARILLLSQDTLEARATGGFMGTYGVIHFSHGTVGLEHYGATSDLSYPSPPLPAPSGLGEWLQGRPWDLSNIGWWPDFPSTAALAREMFRRQGGGDVIGVMAVTEDLLGPLIQVTGPVDVPGYGTVTANGLQQRILDEVELKQPPDVPRHKFLNLLSQQVLDRLLHLPPDKVSQLASVASTAAAGSDIQMWFLDPGQEAAVTGTTWAGALPRTDGDFLMLVDSNMWQSKANKDLVRDVNYSVDHGRGGDLVGHVHAVYSNNGPPSFLNPTYLGYVRIYVPLGAHLIGKTDGIRDEGRAPDGPYEVFSTLVRADPQKSATLDVRYTLPADIAPDGQYQLQWVRQVGAGNDHLTADVAGQSKVASASDRTLDFEANLNPHGLRGWLHSRWFFRQLGL